MNPMSNFKKEIIKKLQDHITANLKRQLLHLPKRSTSINNAIQENTVQLIGAIYHLENGTVEFLD